MRAQGVAVELDVRNGNEDVIVWAQSSDNNVRPVESTATPRD